MKLITSGIIVIFEYNNIILIFCQVFPNSGMVLTPLLLSIKRQLQREMVPKKISQVPIDTICALMAILLMVMLSTAKGETTGKRKLIESELQ